MNSMKIKSCKNCFWGTEQLNNNIRCDAFAGKFGEIINRPYHCCYRFEAFKKIKVWYYEVLVKRSISPENVKQHTLDLYRRVAKLNADNPCCKVRKEELEKYNMTDEQLKQYICNKKNEYIIYGSEKTKKAALKSIEDIKVNKHTAVEVNIAQGYSVRFIKLLKLKQQDSREVIETKKSVN